MGDRAELREPDFRMSREEFRAWAQAQPGRYERWDGVVVAMAPPRVGHALRKANVWAALRRAVREAALPCQALPDGLTVEVDDSDYEPDASLHCGSPLPENAVVVPNPIVLVEVLSPSTSGIDRAMKLREYFRLPSVQHYLIVWPDRWRVVHHRRMGQGIETATLTEGLIGLDPPGIEIGMAEIYAE